MPAPNGEQTQLTRAAPAPFGDDLKEGGTEMSQSMLRKKQETRVASKTPRQTAGDNDNSPTNRPDNADRQLDWEQLASQFSFLTPGCSFSTLQVTNQREAIRTLLKAIADAGALQATDIDSLTETILRREELGSTGIGEGIALPHTKHHSVDRIVGAMGYIAKGIDFNSIDEQPVHLVILLISPVNANREHLLALETVARQLYDGKWRHWQAPS
jgi:mannitol/fructose-specific phosphotransferase system IIA component (Ntr-type)